MGISSEKYGKAELRWRAIDGGFEGVVILDGKSSEKLSDDREQRLRHRLRNRAGELHPHYFGMDGAVARFLSFFPDGFRDPLFARWERDYKLDAAKKLAEVLPLECANTAKSTQTAACRTAFSTNMLSPFELARASEVLRSEDGEMYIHGAAKMANGEVTDGILMMTKAVQRHGNMSWPLATYLPFLWCLEQHMFLKPEATKDFAERVGHEFAVRYEPAPTAHVYATLLDLADWTNERIKPLQPRDRVDVQSFIWVVGSYTDEDKKKLELARAANKLTA